MILTEPFFNITPCQMVARYREYGAVCPAITRPCTSAAGRCSHHSTSHTGLTPACRRLLILLGLNPQFAIHLFDKPLGDTLQRFLGMVSEVGGNNREGNDNGDGHLAERERRVAKRDAQVEEHKHQRKRQEWRFQGAPNLDK